MSEPTWELLGGGGVLGGPIDYVGDWAAGTTYQPGQVVRYNGVDYLAVNPSVGQVPPVSAVVSRSGLTVVSHVSNVTGSTGITGTGNGDVLFNFPAATFEAVPHYFELSCFIYDNGGAAQVGIRLHDGTAPGPIVIAEMVLRTATVNPGDPQFLRLAFTPTAGVHTYQVRWRDITTGRTYTIAGASFPLAARIVVV